MLSPGGTICQCLSITWNPALAKFFAMCIDVLRHLELVVRVFVRDVDRGNAPFVLHVRIDADVSFLAPRGVTSPIVVNAE